MKSKLTFHIMVFGIVSNDGHVIPSHIFEEGLIVNPNVFQNILAVTVKPCIEVVAGKPYEFQQDSAPVHRARKT